jgi:hypothetical protein
MKFLSFFSISYLISILYDYIKKRLRDKKLKTVHTPLEEININPVKKQTNNSAASYNFIEKDNEEEYENKSKTKRAKLNSDTIYLKLNDYYEHPDFVFVCESQLDGDPIFGYIGNPRMLNTHNIIYVELI